MRVIALRATITHLKRILLRAWYPQAWDVDDVHAFPRRVLDDKLASYGQRLTPDDYEDILQLLQEQTLRLVERYNPTIGMSCSKYLYQRLYDFGVVNAQRKHFGASRYGRGIQSRVQLEDEHQLTLAPADDFTDIEYVNTDVLSPDARDAFELVA